MNFLAGISETLCFSREFLRRYVSRRQILKSVFSGRCMANPPKSSLAVSSTCNHLRSGARDRTMKTASLGLLEVMWYVRMPGEMPPTP